MGRNGALLIERITAGEGGLQKIEMVLSLQHFGKGARGAASSRRQRRVPFRGLPPPSRPRGPGTAGWEPSRRA